MAEIEGEYQEANESGYKKDKKGVLRDSQGRVVKGSKPVNPGGRPKGVGIVREIAQQYTEESIEKLREIMHNADKPRDQLEAAKYLLDRGWGKPATSVEVQRDNGESETKMIELSKLSRDQLDNLQDMMDIAYEAKSEDDEEEGQ